MGNPFRVLGLDRKADIPTIKRAYAKLLRTHRPDEDAAAFQRLHEAYEACLEQARWREHGWDDGDQDEDEDRGIDGGEVTGPAQPSLSDDPLFAPFGAGVIPADADADADAVADDGDGMHATDDFDTGAFADELVGRMRGDTRQAVEAWLQAHDELYSLDRKRGLQFVVVEALEAVDAGTASRHFDAVTRFFGLDTIAGVDGWLQHRLDAIQQRFGDAAEFERMLRTHAGPDATWADQGIARELLEPFSWLRRLCLVACPGLPGRTGALARALQAADPESAATRLNEAARRFWERATDRRALRWQRLGFMAVRTALWALVVAVLFKMSGDNKGFGKGLLADWATLFAITLGIWLAYALVVAGLMRFRDYNQARMQWDWVVMMTTLGLACGVVAVVAGSSGILPFIMTTIVWVGARNGGEEGGSASQGASLAAGATGYGLALLVLHQLAGESIEMRYLACIAAVYAFASQAINDAVLARKRGIALVRARMQTGWLWRLFQVQGALLVLLMLASVLFRDKTGS